ncbi:MAG: hypothetical protein ABR537_03785 [Gemmatimonadales bacterium]
MRLHGWMLVTALAAVSGACSDDNTCHVSGTLTYLGGGRYNLSGKTYVFRLDDDANENTAPVVEFTSTWLGGNVQPYSFDVTGFAPGSYYLYASITEPSVFQVYGWYNTDPIQPFNPRDLVNVQCGSSYSFDVDAT